MSFSPSAPTAVGAKVVSFGFDARADVRPLQIELQHEASAIEVEIGGREIALPRRGAGCAHRAQFARRGRYAVDASAWTRPRPSRL